MQLFGGSSNQVLVKKIRELGVSIGNANISKFANDEKRVSVGKGSGGAAVLQSFSTPVDEKSLSFVCYQTHQHEQATLS